MNRPAIHDLLGTILSGWYASVAHWVPPGRLAADTCRSCRSSLVAEAIDISPWPHDLIHELAGDLEIAVAEIAESLAEESALSPCQRRETAAEARRMVVAALVAHTDDVVDVLSECVSPRLDRHVSAEAERGLQQLDWLRDAR